MRKKKINQENHRGGQYTTSEHWVALVERKQIKEWRSAVRSTMDDKAPS